MDNLKPLSYFIEKEHCNKTSYFSWLPKEIVAIIQDIYDKNNSDYTEIKTFKNLHKYIKNSKTIYFKYYSKNFWYCGKTPIVKLIKRSKTIEFVTEDSQRITLSKFNFMKDSQISYTIAFRPPILNTIAFRPLYKIDYNKTIL